MRLRKVADAEQRISSLPARSASKFTEKRARTGFAGPGIAAVRPEPDRSRADRALIFCFDAFSYAIRHPPRIKSGAGFSPKNVSSIKSALIKPDHDLIPLLGMICSENRFALSDYARMPCSRFLTDDTEI